MLKSLVESKLSTDFLILEDKEELNCQNLFASFLENHQYDNLVKKINLVCYENPPTFYISSKKFINEKIFLYNYFSNPSGWSYPLGSKTDLSFFLSNPESLSETVFFIDSVSTLAHYHGFCVTYKNLLMLKKHSKKIICVVHGDLFQLNHLEELHFLATAWIKVLGFSSEKISEEKECEVTYIKSGGKVVKQKEIFCINDDWNVNSKIQKTKIPVSTNIKKDIESLTSFKLGIHISEEERKARDKLILPYVKTNTHNKEDAIYQSPIHEWEDDPDDDLDI